MTPEDEVSSILPLIRHVRGQRVILDSDLARLYGVATKRLNQQVRRNRDRFPGDFVFELTKGEMRRMQIATASVGRNWRLAPMVFTEHGAVMAANVLNSAEAVSMSVEVVRAFIRLRRAALSHELLARKLAELEREVRATRDRQDRKIDRILETLRSLISPEAQRRRIGFTTQA